MSGEASRARPRRLRAFLILFIGGFVSLAAIAGLGLLVIAFAIAQGLGTAADPPHPAASLIPEVVSDVVSWDHATGCGVRRLNLRDGVTLELRLLSSGQLRCGEGPWHTPMPRLSTGWLELGSIVPDIVAGRSGLLMYGHDESGVEWIAAARRATMSREGIACKFEMKEDGYVGDGFIHLSSGLLLQKAVDFREVGISADRPEIVRARDMICLNVSGEAVALIRGLGNY